VGLLLPTCTVGDYYLIDSFLAINEIPMTVADV
jgi:hypothetical protein